MRRTVLTLFAAGLSLTVLAPDVAYAQDQDEIIVTGSRMSRADMFEDRGGAPGLNLVKRGDFLLLGVTIESDAREVSERMSELSDTIEAFLKAADADETIDLSIIESGSTVRRLTQSNYIQGVSYGGRPDTSVARMRVKTAIPDKVENSAELATKLSRFVDGIEETGRITISTNGETSVSVVDPYQYRGEVVAKIVDEINSITDALGPEYVAIIKGLDRQVYWDRQGDIDLAFSLPYTYEIIPNTLHSKQEWPSD